MFASLSGHHIGISWRDLLSYTGLFVGLLLCGLFWEGEMAPLPEVRSNWLIFGSAFLGLGFWVGYLWKDKTLASYKRKWIWQQFTKREKEVAEKMLTSLSNKEICDQLFIEHNTLKTHIRNIYRKAGCSNRNEFIKELGE